MHVFLFNEARNYAHLNCSTCKTVGGAVICKLLYAVCVSLLVIRAQGHVPYFSFILQ